MKNYILMLLKAPLFFLMVWGHCIQYCSLNDFNFFENTAFKIIYSFHMPLFMLVSGYLFYFSAERRDMRSLLIHKVQGMLQPIVFATVLNNFLMLLPNFLLSNKFQIFAGSLFEGIGYLFWFLWAVLISSLTVGVAYKSTNIRWLQIILSLLGVFVVAMFPQWNMSLFMYPYFVIGFYGAVYRKRFGTYYQKFKYITLILFPILLSFYRIEHYIYITPMYSGIMKFTELLKIVFFREFIGLVGSIWMLTILSLLFKIMAKKPLGKKIVTIVSRLGETSLQIYCLSVPLLSGYLPHMYRKCVELLGKNIFSQNMFLYNALFTPLLSICCCAILYAIVLILKRTRLHSIIFGR